LTNSPLTVEEITDLKFPVPWVKYKIACRRVGRCGVCPKIEGFDKGEVLEGWNTRGGKP